MPRRLRQSISICCAASALSRVRKFGSFGSSPTFFRCATTSGGGAGASLLRSGAVFTVVGGSAHRGAVPNTTHAAARRAPGKIRRFI